MKLRAYCLSTSILIISALAMLWFAGTSMIAGARQAGRRPRASASSARTGLLEARKRPAQEKYANLPLNFEANAGQADERVKFMARGRGYKLFLTPSEAVLAVRRPSSLQSSAIPSDGPVPTLAAAAPWSQSVLRFEMAGGNPSARMEPQDRLPGITNYFIGNDPAKWHTHIPNFAKVLYRDVYPGINAVYYGKEGRLETDFVVAPGKDPGVIRMRITGAERMEVNTAGELVLTVGGGDVRLAKPVLYQEVEGTRKEVSGGYRLLSNSEAGFAVGRYDRRLPLVIDPTLVFSTYLGGSGVSGDAVQAVAADASGVYVTGFATSTDFPVQGPEQATLGGTGAANAFVTKISLTGASLVFSTYLGGTGMDIGLGIGVDAAGEPSVAGATTSANFPKTLGPGLSGFENAFITKLSANGATLMFSRYLGGSGSDRANAIAVDGPGNSYVTGRTSSPNFPVTGGVFLGTLAGSQNAFVAKISAAGAVTWATYLGGSGVDTGNAVAVDGSNNVHVAGSTSSANFPTQTPIQANLGVGSFVTNAFVSELNSTGTMLNYSTYLGGSTFDQALGIAVDSGRNTVVVGKTNSTDFPLFGALLTPSSFRSDAFVTKIAAGGGSFVFSTVFGDSSGRSEARGVAIDPVSGNIFMTGDTSAIFFPTLDPVQGPAALGGSCECNSFQTGIIVEFKPDGSDYLFSSFFGASINEVTGSSFEEFASGIAMDPSGNLYVAGYAAGTDFPVLNPVQATLKSTLNGFVAKISPATPAGPQVFPANVSLQVSALSRQSHDAIVTLLNGTTTLNISSITFSGPNSADFSEFDTCGAELLPHVVCAITVRATPTAATTEMATLNINDSDASTPQKVGVTVTVVTPPPPPPPPPTGTLTVMPVNLPFASPQEEFTSSAGQPLTLTNTGSVDVTVDIFPQGTNSSDFFTAGGGTCSGTFFVTVPASTSCTVMVAFDPLGIGGRVAQLLVSGNFTGSPATVNLSGTGTATIARLSAATANCNNLASGIEVTCQFSSSGTPPPQIVGTPSALATVTLTNTGATPLTGITIRLSQFPLTAGFALVASSAPCGAMLAPLASCQISAMLTPTAPGNVSGTIFVTDSDLAAPQEITLNGFALDAQATLAPIFPKVLAFGAEPIGITGSNGLFLQNLGSVALAISEPLSGANSGDFIVMPGSCGVSIPAGGNCFLSLTFTPSAAGVRTATVMITSTTAGAMGVPQSVLLTGSGIPPTTAAAVPGSLTFPNTAVSVSSLPLLDTFSNTGTRPLVLTMDPALGGANPGDFSFTFLNNGAGCEGGFIGARYSAEVACPISFTFTPTATGPRSATFTIRDTSSNSPHVVMLQGNGGSGPAVTLNPPGPIAFNNVPVGNMPTQQIVLTNTGSSPLLFAATSPFAFSGANPNDFSQTNDCPVAPLTLAGSGFCTITLKFRPDPMGIAETATLTITDNASPNPMQIVMLSGTGLGPVLTFSPSTGLAFGNQTQGVGSSPLTLRVDVNASFGAWQVGGISIMVTGTGTGANDFTQTNTCGTSVSPDSNCRIMVTFTPSITGPESANLVLAGNQAGSPLLIPLTGTGTAPSTSFTFAPAPGSGTQITIIPGNTAQFNIVLNPSPGSSGPVSFSCLETPPTTTIICSVSPSSATLNGSTPITLVVTMLTNCVAALPPRGPVDMPPTVPPHVFVLWMVSLLGLAAVRRFAPETRLARVAPAVVMLMLTMSWAGCGAASVSNVKGAPTTPAGLYTLTIKATSGAAAQTIQLLVRVT